MKVFQSFLLLIFVLIFFFLSAFSQDENKTDSLLSELKDSLKLSGETGERELEAEYLDRIGILFRDQQKYEESLDYSLKALDIYKELNDSVNTAFLMFRIGNIYKFRSEYEKALEYYQGCLKIKEGLKDTLGMAKSFIGIGNVFINWGDIPKALESYRKTKEYSELIGYKHGVASALIGTGNCYYNNGELDKGIESHKQALVIEREVDNTEGIALCLLNIANGYQVNNKYKEALKYYEEALEIVTKLNNKIRINLILNLMGSLHKELKNYSEAVEYYNKSLKVAEEISYNKVIIQNYSDLSELYEETGDYIKAIAYQKKYTSLKDSLFNEEKHKQIAELQTKYETEKKEKEIELKNIALAKRDEEIKRKNIQRNTLTGGVAVLILLALLIFRGYRQKKKANILLAEKNEEIEAQRDEIRAQRDLATQQRDIISEQKQEITDSIHYAYRIQTAAIPSHEEVSRILKDYFILYKPRDIVSGDFYWIGKNNDKIIIIAADCTGHGVPGAFMSMLGIAFLNEIINKEDITSPDKILNALRDHIIESLKQHGREGDTKDGMDVAAVTIDTSSNKISFAGANNPLYIIRSADNNHELIEIKGDKMPVAIHEQMQPFKENEILLMPDDSLYIFSDGFADQFGGPKGKKFKYKPFKKLLLENRGKSMKEQKEIMENAFNTWKGDQEQVDDVLIMGIKI